jgi:predicted aconitase
MEYIALGCPHCSIRELREITQLLRGRKVNHNVILFVATSTIKYELAKRMGLVKEIEDAGGVVVKGMCPGASIFGRYGQELEVTTVATNSSKNAHYIGAHSGGYVKTLFGSKEQCIEAAIAGKW